MPKHHFKRLSLLSLALLGLGLCLAGIGYLTGGLNNLKTLAKVPATTQTYNKDKRIALGVHSRDILVEPSPDEQIHISYYNISNNLPNSKIKLKEEGDRLFITEWYEDLINAGIVKSLSTILLMKEDNNYNTITIQVPKGSPLEELYGHVDGPHSVNISDSHIKELNLTGSIYFQNSQIDKGNITPGWWGLGIHDSQLKNVRILPPLHEDDYSTGYLTQLSNSQLENVTFEDGLLELNAEGLSVTKDLTIKSPYATLKLQLVPKTRDHTAIHLTRAEAPISSPYFYPEDLPEEVLMERAELSDQQKESVDQHLTQQTRISAYLRKGAKIDQPQEFLREVDKAKGTIRIIDNAGQTIRID